MVETQGIPRGRLFLRTSLLHTAGPPRSHVANPPREPASPVVGLVGYLGSAWQARYANSGIQQMALGHVTLHVWSHQLAVALEGLVPSGRPHEWSGS